MEITFLKAVAMFLGTIFYIFDINTIWSRSTYKGSTRQFGDAIRGVTRVFNIGNGFIFGTICFLYVAYGKW